MHEVRQTVAGLPSGYARPVVFLSILAAAAAETLPDDSTEAS